VGSGEGNWWGAEKGTGGERRRELVGSGDPKHRAPNKETNI